MRSIDTDATIGQVSDAVDQFDEVLTSAEGAVPQLNGALAGVGALLGIDGPKNVVLAFLNNAEAAALGGGPAAQSLLRVDNGSVNIVQQVSSVDFAGRTPLPVAVDDSAMQLYNDIFLTEPNGCDEPARLPDRGTAHLRRLAAPVRRHARRRRVRRPTSRSGACSR